MLLRREVCEEGSELLDGTPCVVNTSSLWFVGNAEKRLLGCVREAPFRFPPTLPRPLPSTTAGSSLRSLSGSALLLLFAADCQMKGAYLFFAGCAAEDFGPTLVAALAEDLVDGGV